MPELSVIQEEELDKLLSMVTPDNMSLNVFLSLARAMPLVAVEIIILCRTPKGIQILLTKRPPADPTWPGLFHSAGSVVRNKEPFEKTCKRIFVKELKLIDYKEDSIEFVNWHNTVEGERGHVVSLVHRYWLPPDIDLKHLADQASGQFFPISELPEAEMIQSQIPVIKIALP